MLNCWLSKVIVQACPPRSTLTTFKPAAGDQVIDAFMTPCCRISSRGASGPADHREPPPASLAPRVNQTLFRVRSIMTVGVLIVEDEFLVRMDAVEFMTVLRVRHV